MINVIVEAPRPWLEPGLFKKAAQQTLAMEGIKEGASLNILFTDNKRIKALNRRYLGRNSPTDVMAFGANKKSGFIGEIAISVEMAESNGREYGNSSEDELKLYVVHGILHLLGYDDRTGKRRKIMEERQGRIHSRICISL
jgi:probable rRNA maturation factor